MSRASILRFLSPPCPARPPLAPLGPPCPLYTDAGRTDNPPAPAGRGQKPRPHRKRECPRPQHMKGLAFPLPGSMRKCFSPTRAAPGWTLAGPPGAGHPLRHDQQPGQEAVCARAPEPSVCPQGGCPKFNVLGLHDPTAVQGIWCLQDPLCCLSLTSPLFNSLITSRGAPRKTHVSQTQPVMPPSTKLFLLRPSPCLLGVASPLPSWC